MQNVIRKLNRFKSELDEFNKKPENDWEFFSNQDYTRKSEYTEEIYNLICIKIYDFIKDNDYYLARAYYYKDSKIKIIRDNLLDLIIDIYNLFDIDKTLEAEKKLDKEQCEYDYLNNGLTYCAKSYNNYLESLLGFEFNVERTITFKDFVEKITDKNSFYDFDYNKPLLKDTLSQLDPEIIFHVSRCFKNYNSSLISDINKYDSLIDEYKQKYLQLSEIEKEIIREEIDVFDKFNKHCFISISYRNDRNNPVIMEKCNKITDYFKKIKFYDSTPEKTTYSTILPYAAKVINVLIYDESERLLSKPDKNLSRKENVKELTKDGLLRQINIKPAHKRVLDYALGYNNSSFSIYDLASWYYKKEEYDKKKLELLGKYFSSINKKLNEFFGTKKMKYIWQTKENIDDLDNRKKNSENCVVEIPLKQ